jgi:hypothetical protein
MNPPDTTPSDFICPITHDVMQHPVMNRFGLNYERRAILEWLSNGNLTCPITRQPLKPSMLLPNVRLETKIRVWMLETGQYEEFRKAHRKSGTKNLDFLVGFVCV